MEKTIWDKCYTFTNLSRWLGGSEDEPKMNFKCVIAAIHHDCPTRHDNNNNNNPSNAPMGNCWHNGRSVACIPHSMYIWSVGPLCQHYDKIGNGRRAEKNDELLTLLLFTIFRLHSHTQSALCMENAGRICSPRRIASIVFVGIVSRSAYAGPGIAFMSMLPFSSNSVQNVIEIFIMFCATEVYGLWHLTQAACENTQHHLAFNFHSFHSARPFVEKWHGWRETAKNIFVKIISNGKSFGAFAENVKYSDDLQLADSHWMKKRQRHMGNLYTRFIVVAIN